MVKDLKAFTTDISRSKTLLKIKQRKRQKSL
jgi:hypothetical protein